MGCFSDSADGALAPVLKDGIVQEQVQAARISHHEAALPQASLDDSLTRGHSMRVLCF